MKTENQSKGMIQSEKKADGFFGLDSDSNQKVVTSVSRSELFENQADIWLTTEEAAEFLRISARSLLNLTSMGRIRYFKLGRRNRFLLQDLSTVLRANARGGQYGN
jgi:excisionase family DNA binding protein